MTPHNTAAVAPGTSTADREVLITRLFDAPRELVFQAWTDPRHVGRWWGPRGFTTTTHEIDVRPGGIGRHTMHGPDGVDYPNRIAFREIVPPERLVYDHGNDNEPGTFHVTVTFVAEDGGTRVTMRSLFDTAAERDHVVREYHAIEGGHEHLERLAGYLATTAASGSTESR